MEIKVIKNIKVFGFKIQKGAVITETNNDKSFLMVSYHGENGQSVSMPIIFSGYNKTKKEFVDEIILVNK